jgi:hypothetical protein
MSIIIIIIIIIDLSYIMYNDLWMWNKTKLNWEPKQLSPSPSPDDGCIQFPKRCVFQHLEFRTMDKVQ